MNKYFWAKIHANLFKINLLIKLRKSQFPLLPFTQPPLSAIITNNISSPPNGSWSKFNPFHPLICSDSLHYSAQQMCVCFINTLSFHLCHLIKYIKRKKWLNQFCVSREFWWFSPKDWFCIPFFVWNWCFWYFVITQLHFLLFHYRQEKKNWKCITCCLCLKHCDLYMHILQKDPWPKDINLTQMKKEIQIEVIVSSK